MSTDALIESLARELVETRREVERLRAGQPAGWATWTPTVTQSGAVTVTVNYARYVQVGKLVTLAARITVTDATNAVAGNRILIGGLPATAATAHAYQAVGSAICLASGLGSHVVGSVCLDQTTALAIITHASTSYAGINPAWTLANTDAIGFTVTYEVA